MPSDDMNLCYVLKRKVIPPVFYLPYFMTKDIANYNEKRNTLSPTFGLMYSVTCVLLLLVVQLL